MLETLDKAFAVRRAIGADAPALAEAISLIDEETEFLGPPGEYRRRWADGLAGRIETMAGDASGAYVVAAHGEDIIGFLGAFAGTFARTRGIIYVAHVGIRRAWRGRGVGNALFAAIEDWARGQGAWRLELRVDEENARGLGLYRKRGYVVEGRIPDAATTDGAWRNHLWMGQELRRLTEPPWTLLDLAPRAQDVGTLAPAIRRVRIEDAAGFRRFEPEQLGETPYLLKQPQDVAAKEEITRRLTELVGDPTCFSLVATLPHDGGERIVGYAVASREPPSRMHHNAIVMICLLRAHWGRGIGQNMAAQIEAWAREVKVHRLTAALCAHNARALRFAAAQGFVQEVFSPRYAVIDGRAVDRVRLGKVL